jgi:hypothetical protein
MAKAKNIIWIMCDQLRHDYLGCTGHPTLTTPNIDAMAARGVRFTNAYVQSPICGPSRKPFYTGRYMRSHGSHWNGWPLRPTLGTQDREDLHAAGTMLRHRVRERGAERQMAADEVGHNRRAAAIGHARHRHAQRVLESRAGEVRDGPVARHAKGGLVRMRLQPGDELRKIFCLDLGPDDNAELEAREQRDRNEVRRGIEARPGLPENAPSGRDEARLARSMIPVQERRKERCQQRFHAVRCSSDQCPVPCPSLWPSPR